MKTVLIDRNVVESLFNLIGKLPIESGCASLHTILLQALNAPADKEPTVVKKPQKTKTGPKSKSAPLLEEFLKNNPSASKEDAKAFLISRGLSEQTARNVVNRNTAKFSV